MPCKLITRASPLARHQAEKMRQIIMTGVEIVTTSTLPDNKQDLSLPELGYASSFCHELDQQVLLGHADVACHSLKDTPLNYDNGLKIIAISQREDPSDAWVSEHPLQKKDLRVGTSSLRRKMLLEHYYPHTKPQVIRGNVGTRIAKLGQDYDGLILASAGLHRLGETTRIKNHLPLDTFIPPAGQGFIALVAREDHQLHLKPQDQATWETAMLERHIARSLGISCHEPAGIFVNKTSHFNCFWFIGDLRQNKLLYGHYQISSFKNLDKINTELSTWRKKHSISDTLAYNRKYIHSLAKL